MLVSDMTQLLLSYREKKLNFDISLFIDILLDKIGNNGTLLIPTYNFDFCKGLTFDYRKTPTLAGSIGRVALKRKDFKRTVNPIHSFAVAGKDQNILCNLKHSSSFGDDSPFFYMHQKNTKYLSISLDFTNLGFTPAHYVEEKVGVSYRYFKNFSGDYIDENRNKKKVNYKFYVRNVSKIDTTGIKKNAGKILSNIKAYKKFFLHNELFGVVDLKKALDFFISDMKNNIETERLIYPINNFTVKRIKINKTNAHKT